MARGGANRSAAVMQQRSEPHDSLDDFPTPPWATRALCEFLGGNGWQLENCTVREPCANRGHMVRPLAEYFDEVDAADIHDYGCGFPIRDFLFGPKPSIADWTIFNPPFRLGAQFIDRALDSSSCGAAAFVRGAFTEGDERYRELFSVRPPAFVLQFVERVCLLRGRLVRIGEIDPLAEKPGTKAGTATSYCGIVWMHGEEDTRYRWIPKCRLRLECDGDYPADPTGLADLTLYHTKHAGPAAGPDSEGLGSIHLPVPVRVGGAPLPSIAEAGQAQPRGADQREMCL